MRVCNACDNGQRYCSERCVQLQRRAAQRNASRSYQRTPRGARLHAKRNQRYRDRLRRRTVNFSAQKVTQQQETQVRDAATFRAWTPDADARLPEESSAHGPIHEPPSRAHGVSQSDGVAAHVPARSVQAMLDARPGSSISPRDTARDAPRAEISASVCCTFCGRPLPNLARLSALGRRTATHPRSRRAVRRRAPRTPAHNKSDDTV
jgi:hypothetical protein